MTPSSKLIASLNRSLQRIADDQFDEFDIKLLLIDMREYLREETFLREVADFVAHPERERGVCHKAINTRYAKMKMSAARAKQLFESGIITREPNKPDHFYTDQVLGYISLPKIAKQDYQLFVLDSLDDLTDDIILKYYNLNKKNAHQLLQKSFTKEPGFYCLKSTLSSRDIYRVNDLLKFIRGTILSTEALSYDSLRYEFTKSLGRVSKELCLTNSHVKSVSKKFDDVFVCILALMHDAKFKLYDGAEARVYLSLYGNKAEPHLPASTYTLMLVAETPEISFPLVTSAISYASYIDEVGMQPAAFDFEPIPWVHARRVAGQLRLQLEAVD